MRMNLYMVIIMHIYVKLVVKFYLVKNHALNGAQHMTNSPVTTIKQNRTAKVQLSM